MMKAFWTDERISGSLLVASFLILLLALIILLASGATSGFSAMLQGSLAQVAPYAATFRLLILLFMLAWIEQLMGLGLLTRLLLRAGSERLATLSFILAFVAVLLALLNSSFRMSVELWAAQEAARIGSIPEIFTPLKTWANSFFRIGSRGYYIATAGFGWAIARTRCLSPWVGWATIGWSLSWLLIGLGGGVPPAIPLIMPVVIGVALLGE